MFRAGAILLTAMLAIAAIPIQRPLEPRPAQPVSRDANGGAAHNRTPAPISNLQQAQSYITTEHTSQHKEHTSDSVDIGKTLVELLSIAVTAAFTVALALWTRGLKTETSKLVSGGDAQVKKMTEAITATIAVADATSETAAAMFRVATGMAENAAHTEALSEAAAKSAATAERALKVLERPFVFAEVTSVTALPGPVIGISGSGRSHPTFMFHAAELSFFNYGRTPAALRFIHYSFEVALKDHGIAPVIDPRRTRGRELPVGTIATPDRPYKETENLRFRFDDLTQIAFAEGEKSLWLVGFVRYEDIFAECHINGFCMVYDQVGGRFVRRGDERYNYARVERRGDIPLE